MDSCLLDKKMIARSLEQIEKELVALRQSSKNLAGDFQQTYSSYLAALGQAARQQLIMASYHLCTQGYAESFLRLSLKERQNLQQGIRQLASGTREKLQALLPEDLLAELAASSGDDSSEKADKAAAISEESKEAIAASHSSREEIIAPDKLARWQKRMENEIVEHLQIGSRYTNLLLKQFRILPKNLPEALIEAAGKAPSVPDGIAGPPNILNVRLEIDNPEEESGSRSKRKKSQQLRVMAIQLRLSEIELADSNVRARRNQLRSLVSRLNSLERDYRQKQEERAIAEAEAAWRASWMDE